ncbi:hypothetical protein WAI453_002838 [Rhynchosporium graminicola]
MVWVFAILVRALVAVFVAVSQTVCLSGVPLVHVQLCRNMNADQSVFTVEVETRVCQCPENALELHVQRGRRRVLASGSTLTTMAGKGLQMTVIRSST